MKDKNLLNNSEKVEIKTDVKAAFEKAKKNSSVNYKIVHTSKNQTPTIIATVVIILIIASLGVYWYLANNPKTIFIRSIDVFESDISANVKSPKHTIEKGIIDIKYKLEPEDKYQNLNNLRFQIKYTTDASSQITKLKVSTITSPIEKTTYNLYQEKNNKYLIVDEYPNKLFKIDNDFIYNSKNIKSLIKSFKESFVKSIDGQKLSGSNEKIVVNKKQINAYKVSLNLNKNELDEFLNKLSTNLKNNKRFITSYSKVYNINKQDVTNYIDTNIQNYKEKTKNIDNLSINIYTKGLERQFVKIECVDIQGNKTNTIGLTKINDKNFEYIYEDRNSKKSYKGTIKIKEGDDVTTYKITVNKTVNNTVTLIGDFKIIVKESEAIVVKPIEQKEIIEYQSVHTPEKRILDKKSEASRILINTIKQ